MRTAFIETLEILANEDSRVCLVVGDLGYSVIERFATAHPKQFVNAGVAEQDMIGLATGMALSGKVVFTYSIGNFATLRCLEQIRNDACYHRANVKVVAVGGGLVYGALGASHHACEDLAILRSLPELTVVAPGDPVEARLATRALFELDGPAYLRLGKAGERVVHASDPTFRLGMAIQVREGHDLTLISTGSMLAVAVDVADQLAVSGASVRVLSMHTISPLDRAAVVEAATSTRLIMTIEEHSIVGGLGSAVAEVLAELPEPRAAFRRIGLPHAFNRLVGSHAFLRRTHGLDLEGTLARVESAVSDLGAKKQLT